MITKESLEEKYLFQKTSIEKLCEEFKCSKTTIYNYLKRYNIPRKIKNADSLLNQKFGKLIVLEKILSTGPSKYQCRCDCGNILVVLRHSLVRGNTKSCGCLLTDIARMKWKGYEEFDGVFLNKIKYNAKKRNLDFNIDLKYLWELFLKQNRKCALTKDDLVFSTNHHRTVNTNSCNLSVDRIDSSKGYIEGNVQFVHKDINQIKWNLCQNKFIKLCNDIYDYQHFDIFKVIDKPKIYKLNVKRWFGDIGKTHYNNIITSAKKREIDFNININEIWNLFLQQNRRCKLSGIELYFGNSIYSGTASLDRIDSHKNYEINNIQFIHKIINKMKGTFDQNYFLNLVYKIAEYN